MNRLTASLTSSEPGVLVVGLGAVTPIGRSAWASAAAVRAGVAGFEAHPYMVDAVGRPMMVASFPWVDESRNLADRVGDALIAAVHEARATLKDALPQPPMVLLLNLPAARPGLPDDFGRSVVARLQEVFEGVFDRIKAAALGHAGGLIALQSALDLMANTPETVCIIAGADSYLDPDVLEWLEETDQLHGAGERNNAWGFMPGEAAGAVLLATRQTLQLLALSPLACVRGVGVGRETRLIGSGTVCTGLGLTDAVRAATASLRFGERLTDTYCDMNGEPYRADEFAFTVTRTRERFVAASDFIAPANCWGDVGAASAPLLIVLACIAGVKAYANGDAALVWASSVNGERGAALLQTAARSR